MQGQSIGTEPKGEIPLVRVGQGDYAQDLCPRDIFGRRPKENGSHSFLLNEPVERYEHLRSSCLTYHALAEYMKCPAKYRLMQVGLSPREESAAYRVGAAVHALWLEGRRAYESRFQIGGEPRNADTGKPMSPTSNAYKEWRASVTKPLITESQSLVIEQCYAALCDHREAARLISGGTVEGVIRAMDSGHRCQSRLDCYGDSGIVDLKTCEDLDEFERDAIRYRYIHQMAFYRRMVALAGGPESQCYLVAVEKQLPHRVGVWHIDPSSLDVAEDENVAAMASLKMSEVNSEWPTLYEDVRKLGFFSQFGGNCK